jgi:peptidylprolyl isomerase
VKVLPSGLQYRVIDTGTGAKPTQASEVQVQYKTSLPDGQTIADTTQSTNGQPASPLSVKISEVAMSGLREALLNMPAGSRWEVVIPANLARGSGPDAGRLANQALVFDLKLVSVK